MNYKRGVVSARRHCIRLLLCLVLLVGPASCCEGVGEGIKKLLFNRGLIGGTKAKDAGELHEGRGLGRLFGRSLFSVGEQQNVEASAGEVVPPISNDPWRRHAPSTQLRGHQCGQTLYERERANGYGGHGIMSWQPEPDSFLLMLCHQGEVSSRMKCIRNHLLYAGLLNRTLVIPMDPFEVPGNYDYQYLFDVGHFRKCYGENTVMTTSEYHEKHGSLISVDRVFCWTEKFDSCPVQNGVDVTLFRQGYFTAGFFSEALLGLNTAIFPKELRLHMADLGLRALKEEFLVRYRLPKGKTILLGDMLHTEISHAPELYQSGDVPFFRSSMCPSSLGIQPHEGVFWAAHNFVRQFLGSDYFGVHLLRAPTSDRCGHGDACSFPMPQLAECLQNKMGETNINTLFLITDAPPNQMTIFGEIMEDVNGRPTEIVTLPRSFDMEGWAKPLKEYGLVTERSSDLNPLLLSAIEEVICSFAAIFVGSSMSPYTEEIERLRSGLGTANCEDSLLCDGEPPWAKDDFRLQPFEERN